MAFSGKLPMAAGAGTPRCHVARGVHHEGARGRWATSRARYGLRRNEIRDQIGITVDFYPMIQAMRGCGEGGGADGISTTESS